MGGGLSQREPPIFMRWRDWNFDGVLWRDAAGEPLKWWPEAILQYAICTNCGLRFGMHRGGKPHKCRAAAGEPKDGDGWSKNNSFFLEPVAPVWFVIEDSEGDDTPHA